MITKTELVIKAHNGNNGNYTETVTMSVLGAKRYGRKLARSYGSLCSSVVILRKHVDADYERISTLVGDGYGWACEGKWQDGY